MSTGTAWAIRYEKLKSATDGPHHFNAGDTVKHTDGREGYVVSRTVHTARVRWTQGLRSEDRLRGGVTETVDQLDEDIRVSCHG